MKEEKFSVMLPAKLPPPIWLWSRPQGPMGEALRNSFSEYKHVLAPQVEEWLSLGHRSVKGNNPNKYSRIPEKKNQEIVGEEERRTHTSIL